MRKTIVILFVLILSTNCSTKKEMTLRQVSTDREVIIRVDTTNYTVRGLRFPLLFEFINPDKEARSLEDAVYMYHTRYYSDSSQVAGLRGWLSNGLNYAMLNEELVELNRINRVERRVSNSDKSRNLFYPFISIDTTYATQMIFAPHITKLKKENTDTIAIPANKFIKQYPDFCKKLLLGDSIYFKVYGMDNKQDTTLVRRIQLLSD